MSNIVYLSEIKAQRHKIRKTMAKVYLAFITIILIASIIALMEQK
jgi:hypothetical protein